MKSKKTLLSEHPLVCALYDAGIKSLSVAVRRSITQACHDLQNHLLHPHKKGSRYHNRLVLQLGVLAANLQPDGPYAVGLATLAAERAEFFHAANPPVGNVGYESVGLLHPLDLRIQPPVAPLGLVSEGLDRLPDRCIDTLSLYVFSYQGRPRVVGVTGLGLLVEGLPDSVGMLASITTVVGGVTGWFFMALPEGWRAVAAVPDAAIVNSCRLALISDKKLLDAVIAAGIKPLA